MLKKICSGSIWGGFMCVSWHYTLLKVCSDTSCVIVCLKNTVLTTEYTLWWRPPRQARPKQLCSGATNKRSESVSIVEKERKLWFRSKPESYTFMTWNLSREIRCSQGKFLHDAPNKCGDDRQRTWTQSRQICAGRNSYRMGGVSVKHTKG